MLLLPATTSYAMVPVLGYFASYEGLFVLMAFLQTVLLLALGAIYFGWFSTIDALRKGQEEMEKQARTLDDKYMAKIANKFERDQLGKINALQLPWKIIVPLLLVLFVTFLLKDIFTIKTSLVFLSRFGVGAFSLMLLTGVSILIVMLLIHQYIIECYYPDLSHEAHLFFGFAYMSMMLLGAVNSPVSGLLSMAQQNLPETVPQKVLNSQPVSYTLSMISFFPALIALFYWMWSLSWRSTVKKGLVSITRPDVFAYIVAAIAAPLFARNITLVQGIAFILAFVFIQAIKLHLIFICFPALAGLIESQKVRQKMDDVVLEDSLPKVKKLIKENEY